MATLITTVLSFNQTPEAVVLVQPLVSQETSTTTIAARIEQVFNDPIALKIAECESGLRQFHNDAVLRGVVNSKDVGIFQINEYYHLEQARAIELNIYEPEGNIQYAKWLMDQEGYKPWNWSKDCWNKGQE